MPRRLASTKYIANSKSVKPFLALLLKRMVKLSVATQPPKIPPWQKILHQTKGLPTLTTVKQFNNNKLTLFLATNLGAYGFQFGLN